MLSPALRLSAANLAALRARETRVVVIGPSGWLGAAALAMLDRAFAGRELADRVTLFGSRARSVATPSGGGLDCRDGAELPGHDLSASVVLHFGYLTRDRASAMATDDYVAANEAIQDRVVRAIEASPPAALFFASSGAVYQGCRDGVPSREANPYGWLKLKHEEELARACARAGTRFVNGRIFTLAGECINKVELYALGSMLTDLKNGGPIRLRSAEPVVRSYAYVGDVINLALALLLRAGDGAGRDSLSFDMAGAEPVEIGELARLCAGIVGRPDAAIIRPPLAAGPGNRMLGDHAAYTRELGRQNIAALPLAAQVAATASFLGLDAAAPR